MISDIEAPIIIDKCKSTKEKKDKSGKKIEKKNYKKLIVKRRNSKKYDIDPKENLQQ